MKYVILYLLTLSLIGVVLTIYDKVAAIYQKRRVPEKTIFAFSFLGAAAAIYITMKIIRHKTLHKRFMVGLPCIILLQIALCFTFKYLTTV